MTFSRSTSANSWGTLEREVVLSPASSGSLRASVKSVWRFDEKNSRSLPARSSSTNVKPPDVPMPGMAGGEKENAIPSGSDERSVLIRCLMAWSCSERDFRSPQGFRVTKKKALKRRGSWKLCVYVEVTLILIGEKT